MVERNRLDAARARADTLRFIKNLPTEVAHYALFEREIGNV